MIYDPLNSLIFFPLIQVVVFLFLHFHSPVLTRDRQDNRNYREIKFNATSFPVGPREPVPGLNMGGVKTCMHSASVFGCVWMPTHEAPRVWPVQCVTRIYFVFCCDLVWQLTEGWEQWPCRPWSARRNSWDTPRQGESYLVTPTLPSPVTAGLPYCLLPFSVASCQPADPLQHHTNPKLCSACIFISFSYEFQGSLWKTAVFGQNCPFIYKHWEYCPVTVQLYKELNSGRNTQLYSLYSSENTPDHEYQFNILISAP